MKKLIWLILLLAGTISLHAEKFYIPHYSVKVKVLKSGEFEVTEVIEAYFTQSARGIIRQINLGGEESPWQGMAYRAKGMPIQVSGVSVKETEFKVMDSEENQLKIRMGNEFIEVSGKQTYTIQYHVKYAINHFADHSEFYWNLIGHYWATNIDEVDFSIELPTNLRISKEDVRVYTGKMGSQESNVAVEYLPGMIKGKSTSSLASFQGMTLAFKVPPTYFTREDLGIQLSKGQGSYIKEGKNQFEILENGDIRVRETIHLVANNIPEISRTYPASDLPIIWEDFNLKAKPALQYRISSNKVKLYTPDSRALEGEYQITLEYRIRGLIERNGLATRILTLPGPTLDGLTAALKLSSEVILPGGTSPSPDSLSANWTGLSPWNEKSKPLWTGNRLMGELPPQQTSTDPLNLRISFPNSLLKVPDLPASFYSNEYIFSDYTVHLHLLPDATIRFDQEFSVEEIVPQTQMSTMGIPTRRDKPENYWGTEMAVPAWGPNEVGWFESGTWIEASDEEGWSPGITKYYLEGFFTPLEIPWQAGQKTGKATTSQFGWLKPDGDQYAFQIPLFVGRDQAIRRPKVVIHLPEGASAGSEAFRLVRHYIEWNGEGMPFWAKGNGNLWEIELDRPLRANEYVLLRGSFPQAGFTGPTFSTSFQYWWDNNTSSLIALAFIGIVGTLLFALWFIFGRDRRITIVPQFGPPEGVSPAEAGLLWDGRLHTKDLMTLIPYWASKGYIQVENDKSQFKFKQLKPLPESSREFELTLFKGLFEKPSEDEWVTTQSLKDKFYRPYEKAARQLLAWAGASRIFVPGTRGFGLLLTILGTVALLVGLVGTYLSWSDAAIMPTYYPLIPLWGGVAISGGMAILFGRIMPKRGRLKKAEYAHLLGFREFIETVEADRLKVLVDENPAYFDETLPFAIVMGLAEKWAQKFDTLLARESVGVGKYMDSKDRNQHLDVLTRDFLKKLNMMHQTMTYRTPPPPSQRSYSSSGSSYSSSSSTKSWSSRSSSWSSRSASSGGSSFGSRGGYSGGGYGGGGGSSW